jgi:endonuclease YncB( thermonuclease family)
MALLLVSIAHADPVKPADIHVIDSDTIDALGKRIRLVGFDAPELGDQCPLRPESSAHAVRAPKERWPAITKGPAAT